MRSRTLCARLVVERFSNATAFLYLNSRTLLVVRAAKSEPRLQLQTAVVRALGEAVEAPPPPPPPPKPPPPAEPAGRLIRMPE